MLKTKNNKAQINMMETVAVLLIFFIMIAIGFVFYVKVMKGNIEIEAEKFKQLESIEIAQRAMFFPELQCSEENIVTNDCIDLLKLKAAAGDTITGSGGIMSQNKLYYSDRLGFSKISITEIYPGDNNWVLYDYSLAGGDYADKITSNIPILIKNSSEKKKYSFGIMEVEVYTK